ncbi:MAG: thiol:disulfide interchange protein DsbA/DsbL [Algicola sp.]|nr:thiol:disulfide interchange protein DsbA/DsbL [Algicola sp.]
MKRIALFFVTLLLSLSLSMGLSLNAYAAPKFVEGEHYRVFSNAGSTKPVVTEYFSFYCPHCYRFEGAIKQIKKDLPAGVKFQKNHVDTTRLGPADMQKSLSLALAVIDKMKLGQKLTTAIFEYMHKGKDKKKFKTVADIRQLFVANGVDGKAFDKAMKNFSVKIAAKRMAKGWLDLPSDIRQIGVPSITVNDKYWINAKKLNGKADYKAIIEYLTAL